MNNISLTKREKTTLIIVAILAIIFLFIPQQVINEWEYLTLLIIVFPIGIYIATDPERMHKDNK